MARTVKLLKKGEDPVGAPDFTLPVSILAQIIESLKVDIVAQTLSTLKIEISAVQTGLVIQTNVTNFPSTYPLPDSQVSTLQNITITNIAAGIVFNVNVSQISCALNINNWPSTFPLPGEQVSSLQQITIQNVAAGLYIPINIAQATATVNSNATISGVVAGVYVPIIIHSVESGVIFNVNIGSVGAGVTFNVNITGSTTLNVNIVSSATIGVTIASQNVTLNVDQLYFRKEYSPDLVGVPVWLQHAIIPTFSAEEQGRGIIVYGNATVANGLLTVPPQSSALLNGNIHYGSWVRNYTKWGIKPQAGAWRSMGFDNPDWYNFIGFWMYGNKFYAVTHDIEGDQFTDITDRFPADGDVAYHTYEIYWLPEGVKFYIDKARVAWHKTHHLSGPHGLEWRVKDNISGSLVQQGGWELSQWREGVSDTIRTENLLVDLAAQSIGNVKIDIAAQSIGNVGVTIAAQTVDLNIKTSGGANIVIDKLTQSAYTERRSTLQNDSAATGYWAKVDTWLGKFFPRGCRGIIRRVAIELGEVSGVQRTITVYFAPYPGAGEVASVNLTLPANQSQAWIYSGELWRMWNYDSMFVFCKETAAGTRFYNDVSEPMDSYFSQDGGVTWKATGERYHFRVELYGETVGDLPVSGIVNTIEIPSSSSGGDSGTVFIDGGQTKALIDISGAGVVHWAHIIWLRLAGDTPMEYINLIITVDDMTFTKSLAYYYNITGGALNTPTPVIVSELNTAPSNQTVHMTLWYPFNFRRRFTVAIANTNSAGNSGNANVRVHYSIIK